MPEERLLGKNRNQI